MLTWLETNVTPFYDLSIQPLGPFHVFILFLTSSTDTVGSCCLSVTCSRARQPDREHTSEQMALFYPRFKRFRTPLYNPGTTSGLHHLSRLNIHFPPAPSTSHSPSYAPWLLVISAIRRKDFLRSPFCAHAYTPPHTNCTVIGKQYQAHSSQHFSSVMQPCHQKSVCFAHVIEPHNDFGLQQNFCLFRS